MEWEYEPDEIPKRKHFWDKDEAGLMILPGCAHESGEIVPRLS